MYYVNMVVGRLGKDVELRYTSNKTPLCNINVAETRGFKNSDDQWENRPVWHRFTVWGKLAERVARVLHKGSLVLLHFRIDYQAGTLRGKNGSDYETQVPQLVLTNFEALANFGNNHADRQTAS